MGYLSIDNLYKNQDVLLFKECYALEKIHGTSAHVRWDGTALGYFSGGEKHDNFVKLFEPTLPIMTAYFTEHFANRKVVVYGEAYGGKQQGMKDTYGPSLKFIVFDVQVEDMWLAVPQAERVALGLGLEFVDYVKVTTDLDALNHERDRDSAQAVRNGMGPGKQREGVILRPLIEVTKNNGSRIISKHKCEQFSEHKKPREVSPEKAKAAEDAAEIADDWVTPMRLEHVLDKLQAGGFEVVDMTATKTVIAAMLADVKKESEGEIVWTTGVEAAIGRQTAKVLKQRFQDRLKTAESEVKEDNNGVV